MPTMKKVGSDAGNAMAVGARSSVLAGEGVFSTRYSCAWLSMSNDQEHTAPSIDAVMMLWAFFVPIMLMLYTGWV